jgi:hypothetical protein
VEAIEPVPAMAPIPARVAERADGA